MGSISSKTDHGLLKLKIQRDQMVKYRKKLEFQSEQALKMAKLNINNKKLAVHYLAQKKKLTTLVSQVDAQQMLLFEMINEIELKSVQVQVMSALQQGNSLLTELNIKLKDSDKVIDELKDQMDIDIFDPIEFTEELLEFDKLVESTTVFPIAPTQPLDVMDQDAETIKTKVLA